LNRREKEQLVAELHEQLKGSRLAVLTAFRGMNVGKSTALRNALRKSKTEFKVVKNTLLRIAAQDTDISALAAHFQGPSAIALNSGDIVETSKVLIEFAKKNAELEIKLGILDGKVISKEQISMLASLPSREVLLGRLLSVMVGVPTALVTVLSAVPRSFVQVLAAYQEKRESGN
jgi:large subunit ribosomal protein L10